jgi:HTH-type transcriptional regulator/antitoxin HigA
MTTVLDEAAYVQTLAEFTPHPIHSDADNERAIAMLEAIDSLPKPTPEQLAAAEVLTTLVQDYESRYALGKATGAAVLRELMLARDLKRKDLEDLASRGTLADILNGKRNVGKSLAQKLGERFNVPYSVFL